MTVSLGYVIAYVQDVETTLSFYTEAFGLPRRFITPDGDYGELNSGATVLAFASKDLAGTNLDAAGGFAALESDGPPPGISITLITDDVVGTVDAAVGAGARRYVDPIDKPWGQTVAYLIDPNGLLVEVATAVAT